MPTLTDEIKVFIVRALACFDTPAQVARAVKSTFGVEVSRRHVYAYDPRCPQPPAPRWQELYGATRAALLREASEIGVVHKNVRLRMLDRMARSAEENHYLDLAAALLAQAAKECGGVYDRRAPSVSAPLPTPPDRVQASGCPGRDLPPPSI